MSVTAANAGTRSSGASALWDRKLETYPDTGPRVFYLGITVLATIMLYYELYVGSSVSTLVLQKLGMSFSFYVTALAFGNLMGAFGSLFAGLTDRLGRCNLVVVGLLVTGVLTAFVVPAVTSRWPFIIATWAIGVVEGICLVATPALIRDFSPQVGRAAAMGFWTSGPVFGSLVVSIVATNTISVHTNWPTEYRICGIAGLVVFVIAALTMRELSPGLRDQLMVTMRDRVLIEARAKGIDIEASLRNPWRQLLKADVVVSAFAVSVMLAVYYTFVAFGVIYFATIFGKTLKDANGLGNWGWTADAVAVIGVGFLSDRLRVRKPFMVIGGVLGAVSLIVFLVRAGHPTSYYHLAALVAAISFFLGIAYTPWMASFTETVEARNPALTATGLAIWGWIIRVVVFALFLLVPAVINTVTPLVNYGSTAAAYEARYGQQIAVVSAHPALFAQLAKYPNTAAIPPALIQQAITELGGPAKAIPELQSVAKVPPPVFTFLGQHGAQLQKAAKDSPGQWKHWWWICVGGMVFFLLCIPLLRGRWSPKAAREDEEAHEAMVEAELTKLNA